MMLGKWFPIFKNSKYKKDQPWKENTYILDFYIFSKNENLEIIIFLPVGNLEINFKNVNMV